LDISCSEVNVDSLVGRLLSDPTHHCGKRTRSEAQRRSRENAGLK